MVERHKQQSLEQKELALSVDPTRRMTHSQSKALQQQHGEGEKQAVLTKEKFAFFRKKCQESEVYPEFARVLYLGTYI